jgi:transcriptional regulator with XRE-family HTH domain
MFGNLCDQDYKQFSDIVKGLTTRYYSSMITNVKRKFADWLEQTFLKWQAEKGKRSSLLEFAEYIGYSRPLISMWLAGQRLPAQDGIKRLADLFGLEIYDVLEIPRPNPYLQKINQVFDRVSPEYQQKLAEDAEHYAEHYRKHTSKKSKKLKNTLE